MGNAIQFRRSSTSQLANITGLVGEVTIDSNRNIPVIHDGITPGGNPIVTGVVIGNGNDFNIITPTITSPAAGSTGFTGVVRTSTYATQDVFQGLHTATDWEIASDSAFSNIIYSNRDNTINLNTFTFPGTNSTAAVYIRVRYVSGVHRSAWSPTIITAPRSNYISAPTISVQGSPNSIPLNPTLTGSTYSTVGSTETHVSSDWVVVDSVGFSVWSSLANTTNLTSIQLPQNTLVPGATYSFSVVYHATTLISAPALTQGGTIQPTISTPTLTVQGTPSVIPLNPSLSASVFVTDGPNVTHVSTDWTVTDSLGVQVWSSLGDTTNLTSVQLPANTLTFGVGYTFTVQYNSANLNSLLVSVSGSTASSGGASVPTLTVQGAPSSVPFNPTLTGSTFSYVGTGEVHVSSDWTVTNSAGTQVWSSLTNTTNLTSIQLPADTLTVGTTYTFSVVYHSTTLTTQPGTTTSTTIPSFLNAPTLTVQGSPSSVPESPLLTGSAFSILGALENHVSSDWVVLDSLGVQVWSSVGDTVNLTSVRVPNGVLVQGNTYTFTVKYNSTTLTSALTSVTGTTVSVFPLLNAPTLTVQGSPSSVPESPTLTGSVFSILGALENHVSSDWVVKNSTGSIVWSSLGDTVNLTSIQVPAGKLLVNTLYTFTLVYHSATLTGSSSAVQATTVLNYPSIVAPTLTVEGSPSSVPENPLLTGSAYATLGTAETHVSTDWVVTDSAGVTVWSSVTDTVNLETITMPKGILAVNTVYNFTMKYNSATLTSQLAQVSGTTLAVFVYVYQGAWITKAPMPVVFNLHGQSTLLDGTVLVTGGSGGSPVGTNVYLYDPTTDVWTAKSKLPVAMLYHAQVTLLDGTVLVTGGSAATNTMLYNPNTNTWSQKAAIPISVYWSGSTLLADGSVMIIGGYAPGITNVVHNYNPTTNTWTTLAPYPTNIVASKACTLNNGIVVNTGGYISSSVSTVYAYEPSLNSWSVKSPMPVSLLDHAQSTTATNSVLVTGGGSTPGASSTGVYEYDPSLDVWSQKTPLPTALNQHAQSTLLDGTILVTGTHVGTVNAFLYS